MERKIFSDVPTWKEDLVEVRPVYADDGDRLSLVVAERRYGTQIASIQFQNRETVDRLITLLQREAHKIWG